MSSIVFAQFSDSHLFGDKSSSHFGQNVYQNLLEVLVHIRDEQNIQFAIFTGDLTQDHSDQSYRNFVEAMTESGIQVPIYWLAGNHDSLEKMNTLLDHPLIHHDKTVNVDDLQLLLLNSKSDSPAGLVKPEELQKLANVSTPTLIFMHHHPLPVNYFIDRHGLENRQEFWQIVNQQENVIGVACGHIHRGLTIAASGENKAPLYGCPATSIQFDPAYDGVRPLPQGPGYRQFCYRNNTLTTQIISLAYDGVRVS
ncbi:metallophosphoesterase [Thalassotalea litorea]|uniref:metallophosphoesterase n=1 Tax=Thalassotalea litorea TaxID=2020715 RepID=UPI001485AAB9|nr:metallophosphoesterase [Thalassotalea litorea]